jgi:PTS system mannose-specific IIA component
MEHIVGPQDRTAAIGIEPDDDMEARSKEIKHAIDACDTGSGVIVLTDLLGGTPSNLAANFVEPGKVELVAGVNVPILVGFDSARREMSLSDCAAHLTDMGRRYVTHWAGAVGTTVTPPTDQQELGRRRELSRSLDRAAQGIIDLRNQLQLATVFPVHGGMGHNLPDSAFRWSDTLILNDGIIAAEVSAQEVAELAPRKNVLGLCVNALKRLVRLLERVRKWTAEKADLFVQEAVKSAGKAAGPALLLAIADMVGVLRPLIDALVKYVHP